MYSHDARGKHEYYSRLSFLLNPLRKQSHNTPESTEETKTCQTGYGSLPIITDIDPYRSHNVYLKGNKTLSGT